MNLFVWLWDSWHVKGWDHPEKSALLRVLHELYLCDYEFAATEKGQYKNRPRGQTVNNKYAVGEVVRT